MKRSEVLFGILKIPLDALGIFAALVLAYRLREANIDLLPGIQLLSDASTLPTFATYLSTYAAWGVFLFLFVSATVQLYGLRITLGAWREIGRIVMAGVLWMVFVIAWFFLVQQQLLFSRIMLLHATLFATCFVMVERSALILFQRSLLRSGIGVRRVISFGGQALPTTVEALLTRDVRYVYQGHFHDIAAIKKTHHRYPLDLVLHTDAHPKNEETASLVDYCRNQHIGYAFLPPLFSEVPQHLSISYLGYTPILRFEPTPLDGWGRVWKRLFDLVVSAVLLLVLSPILLCVALIILLRNGWPIFYVSKRIGQHARTNISVIKFRTMCKDADKMKTKLTHMSHRDGPLFKMKDDPRITTLGHVLRRWSIDELPQLFNVFAGQMSLVGPRPHLPEEVSRYKDYERRVFAVKPGMTGLAQISGRSDLHFSDEVRLDMRYIEEWSLLMDLWIMWRTAFVVLQGDGAD